MYGADRTSVAVLQNSLLVRLWLISSCLSEKNVSYFCLVTYIYFFFKDSIVLADKKQCSLSIIKEVHRGK